MTKEKTFCIKCKHGFRGLSKCESPKNYIDTWWDEKADLKRTPDIINKKNNCKWFEPKRKSRKK